MMKTVLKKWKHLPDGQDNRSTELLARSLSAASHTVFFIS
jgi:hypothetical protein